MRDTSRRDLWSIASDVTYLNHGSFGPSPRSVQQARQEWSDRLEAQPMDFYCRVMEDELDRTCRRLGEYLGAKAGNLILLDNSTVGMNVVARSFTLEPGDEVVLTDHVYGAVDNIWREACQQAGARIVRCRLGAPLGQTDATVAIIESAFTERTKLIVLSHVTSATAAILPVTEICTAARNRGIAVCVDGPHAVGMLPVNLRDIGCDYYTASCHKWLCAPFGSGFLYVHPRQQKTIRPVIKSWGGSVSGRPASWKDDFRWPGTRDPAALLTITAAINFVERIGSDAFRSHADRLIGSARERITRECDAQPLLAPEHCGTMVTLELPTPAGWEPAAHGKPDPLQLRLWEQHRLEVPVFGWNRRRCLRVSCHLYNSERDLDRLIEGLRACRDW